METSFQEQLAAAIETSNLHVSRGNAVTVPRVVDEEDDEDSDDDISS